MLLLAAEPASESDSSVSVALDNFPGYFAFAVEHAPDAETARLHSLAAFPKPLREALLELASHPEVVQKLQPGASALERARALEGLPAPVTQAAALLLENPDVLQLLRDYPDDYEPAARTYVGERVKVAAAMDEFEKADELAVDEWIQRLAADDEARDQMRLAAAAFARQPGAAPEAPGLAAGRKDKEKDKDKEKAREQDEPVVVQMMPAPAFNNYVMDNADMYPALASALLGQWLSYGNPYVYDWWWHHWWHRYHRHFHHSLLKHDHHRGHRLAELARLERERSHIHPSKRYHGLDQHAKKYPHLTGLPKHEPSKHPLLAHHPVKPSYRDMRSVPNAHAMRTVQRRPPTMQFRTHQASAAHSFHAAARHGPVGGGRRR
jgi:hypothetical protein